MSKRMLYSMRSVILSQWIECKRKMEFRYLSINKEEKLAVSEMPAGEEEDNGEQDLVSFYPLASV